MRRPLLRTRAMTNLRLALVSWKIFNYRTKKTFVRFYGKQIKPLVSEVLTNYLIQTGEPPWTSYFVKYADVRNDQRGMSHFNWLAGESNYHVLRTGCFPYIKYHCSKRQPEDLDLEDKLFRVIKVMNFGLPTLLYGLAATQLIQHSEVVKTNSGDVTIYFLMPENKKSLF